MKDEKKDEIRAMLHDLLWVHYGYPKIWAEDEWPEVKKAIEKVNRQVDLLLELFVKEG